jgi:hypothetical protein
VLSLPIWLLALVVGALSPFAVGALVAGLEKRVQRRTLDVLARVQVAPNAASAHPPDGGRN